MICAMNLTTTHPVDWLLENAHSFSSAGRMLGNLVGRLNQDNVGLMRVNIYTETLHPQVASILTVWRRGSGFVETSASAKVVSKQEFALGEGIVKEIQLGHRSSINPAFKASPLYQVIAQGESEIHARFDSAGDESHAFPIYADFVNDGATAYFACELRLANGKRGCISWLTDKPSGFTKPEIELLRKLANPIGIIVDVHSAQHITRTLLNTYLGRGPGELVMAGNIKQGDIRRLRAAIWFSDLRGFTKRSIDMPPEALVDLLNKYFSAVGHAIYAENGEILKFIGDAVLAIFPVAEAGSPREACQAALRACCNATAALAERNSTMKPGDQLKQGTALHLGEVQYGNIGADDRLDFTVIGQAVNLASRIEGLCSTLNHSVLMSDAFAANVDAVTEPVGVFALKGIPEEQAVFGLEDSQLGRHEGDE